MFLQLCFIKTYAASYPSTSYVSTNVEQVADADVQEQISPFSSFPMLGGAPELPPDPGAEVPVGDYYPLILISLLYASFKLHKQRKLKIKA